MRRLLFALALLPAPLSAEPGIAHFSGLLPLNAPDAPETAALLAFLHDNDGKLVFLDIDIDTSVSIQPQIDAMRACGLLADEEGFDAADLLNTPLGIPTLRDGQVNCWNSVTFETPRSTLPMNAASMGIVSWRQEGFFLVQGLMKGGQNPPSYHLREIAADAATWALQVNSR
ncbi:hypothetical protein [Stagnihabitans tardus]|uniref:Uncharacterized protein n=1 Tax=Stagnihabitans tardus TaxID=2699202 RepID=A0AAE5BS39_9RHOB|nr:hypothetical protein [Stagnihabitans tardus]NBZ87350.1 hypothetical protein [Stagnihabitans tardus]